MVKETIVEGLERTFFVVQAVDMIVAHFRVQKRVFHREKSVDESLKAQGNASWSK